MSETKFVTETVSIIKDIEVFKETFIPSKILFREKELIELAIYTFTPCANKGVGSNVFISGESGTGKTLSVNYLIEETKIIANKKKININPIYINCSTLPRKGEFHVIRTLCEKFLPKGEFKLGYEITKYLEFMQKSLKKKKSNIILILDEIDKIRSESADRLLSILTRTDFSPSNLTIICIYNNIYFRENLLPATLSSFKGVVVVFTNYETGQLFEILKQRTELGLKSNVIKNGTIEMLAGLVFERFNSDVRKGIEIIERSAKFSEALKKNDINIKNVEETIKKMIETEIRNYFSLMDVHKIYIMGLMHKFVTSNGKVSFSKLYGEYKKILPSTMEPYTDEAIRKKMDEICSTNLIAKKSKGTYIIPGNIEVIKKIIENEVRQRFKMSLENMMSEIK